MSCKYCGKDNQLVFDDLLCGKVCEDCCPKVKQKIDSTKEVVSLFYKKLDSVGLLNAFATYLRMVMRDNELVHFDGVKLDKRSNFPYVLVFKTLSAFGVPEIVEISITDIKLECNRPRSVVKGKYRGLETTSILFMDAAGTFYEGVESFIGSNMSWVKKEFGL